MPTMQYAQQQYSSSAARANDDNSTFLNGRSAVSRKRRRKWHGESVTADSTQQRAEEGNAAAGTKGREGKRVASLLTDLDRSLARCALSHVGGLLPSSSQIRSHRNAGCSPTVAAAASFALPKSQCSASQSLLRSPHSAHINEQQE